jgi:hypothetical protein
VGWQDARDGTEELTGLPRDRGAAAAPQGIDPFFATAGKEDAPWAFAAALRGASDDTGDGWGDVLGQAPWGQDLAAFPPAGR